MLGKKLINAGPVSSGANTFASENFNTVLYTGNGGTQRIGGYINRGAVFNGSSSYIDAGQVNFGANNVSVSLWVHPNSSQNAYANIIDYNHSSSGGWTIQQDNTSTNSYKLTVYDGSSYNVSSAFSLTANQWNHLVFTVTSAGAYSIYVDNGTPTTGTGLTGLSTSTNNNLNIGRWYAGTSRYWGGKLDQIRIFNKAISSSEVTTLYGETHSSTTISTTDIFSDNSGVALYQLDGNANDTGGVSGKFGSGAIFNGSSSVISLGNNFNSIFSNDFTISAWVNVNSMGGQIFGKGTWAINGEYVRLYTRTSTPRIQFGFEDGSGNSVSMSTNSTNIEAAGWKHIVAIGDYTNGKYTLYLDGVLLEEQNITGSLNMTNTQSAYIGNRESNNAPFDGKIDELRIYSDVLTSTEVGYIYNNTTASIPTDNLEAYYKFDGDARDEQQLYDGTASNVTYAYDGTATNVTYQEATSFTPDLIWQKSRSVANHHVLTDSVRGTNSQIFSQTTDAASTSTSRIQSFDEGGFTIGNDSRTNTSGVDYVAWCFKGGGTAVSGSSSQATNVEVSANLDAGFSIVKFRSSSSTVQPPPMNYITHGLDSNVELTIYKKLDSSQNWIVQHKDLNQSTSLSLNLTSAVGSPATYTFFDNTSTSGSIGARSNYAISRDANYIAYCFHSVDGYSKVGTYTGTGASGNSIVTGFQPAFLLIKRTDSTGNWLLFDNERGGTNEAMLRADTSETEFTGNRIDFLSNGFTLVDNDPTRNASGGTYIYLAIAADPDTTTPTVENSFDVVTYEGTGSTQEIATDFKPDLVWIKNRDTTNSHILSDSIRGAGKVVYSNLTNAEADESAYLTSFNSNGFSLALAGGNSNASGNDYVAWCWKAGDHDENLPQINTEGSIDSVVSVNAEAGFSIVKYVGSGSGSSTIGHGLSSAPELIICKDLDSSTISWNVYAQPITADYKLYLNSTASQQYLPTYGDSWYVDSTTFKAHLDGTYGNNVSGHNQIAYCFHSVTGYQKIGTYQGTTAAKQVDVGFQPRFVMIKNSSRAGESWFIADSVRTGDPSPILKPNLSNAEQTNVATDIDFNSNGFALDAASTAAAGLNENGDTYIYLAIK